MHRLVDGAHIGLYPLYGWRTLNIKYLSPWSTPWIQWNDGLQGTDRSPNMLHWQLSAWQWWKEGCGSVRTSRTIPGAAKKNVGDPAKMVLGGSSVFQIHVCIHLSHYLYLSLSPSLHRRLGEELARGKSKNIYKYLHVIIYIYVIYKTTINHLWQPSVQDMTLRSRSFPNVAETKYGLTTGKRE